MHLKLCAALAALAFVLPSQAQVRKCVDAQQRVVYQDAHCKPVATPAPAPFPAHGAWRGEAQLKYLHSETPQDVRAEAALEIEVSPEGRVSGAAAGCRLEGVHAPQASRREVALDVTMHGCKDSRFNGRYAGRLSTDPQTGRTRLGLHAIGATKPEGAGAIQVSLATIDAALRR